LPVRYVLVVFSLSIAIVATGCSGQKGKAETQTKRVTDTSVLIATATTYANALNGGQGDVAWRLQSKRCRYAYPIAKMRELANTAVDIYGVSRVKSIKVNSITGNRARVTWFVTGAKYPAREPWIKERGRWLEDDC
jgi:hypothetical protein